MILPKTIKKDLKDYQLLRQRVSRLGGHNLQFKNSSSTTVYLKSGWGLAAESLRREYAVLQWLEHREILVPKVLNYFSEEKNDKVFLLLSGIEGLAAQRAVNLSRNEILRLVAEALKHFHLLNSTGSADLRTLAKDLEHIRDCLNLDLVKRRSFQAANFGQIPEDVFTYLWGAKDRLTTDTIVHGDYCLPNIILSKTGYGFIDVGDTGPGDPHKDLSALEVSINRNFGKEWIEVFYSYYGPKIKIDEFKIKYFQLIDQFGYHLDIEKYRKYIHQLTSG